MTTYLIELIESLRKLSAENASPRDCIDEAADKLGALAAEVEHWRDEWSEVCNDNQILHNKLTDGDTLLYQVLEALSACDIYAYAGGEGLMSTKHTNALKAIRTRLGLLK